MTGGTCTWGTSATTPACCAVRTIYRIDEPDPSSPGEPDRPLAAAAAVSYILPRSNRFDAEGLVYDHGAAILVAKYPNGREADLFAVTMEPPPVRSAEPRPIGRLPGFTEPATGAGLSEDGTLLAVCSYAVTRVYRRTESPSWKLVAEVRYEAAPIEGIAWDGPDLILAAEEGRGLFRLSGATWRTAGVEKQTRTRGAIPKAR